MAASRSDAGACELSDTVRTASAVAASNRLSRRSAPGRYVDPRYRLAAGGQPQAGVVQRRLQERQLSVGDPRQPVLYEEEPGYCHRPRLGRAEAGGIVGNAYPPT